MPYVWCDDHLTRGPIHSFKKDEPHVAMNTLQCDERALRYSLQICMRSVKSPCVTRDGPTALMQPICGDVDKEACTEINDGRYRSYSLTGEVNSTDKRTCQYGPLFMSSPSILYF